jgi:N6-adenosine-specific RNA methylase IME4
MKKQVDHVEPAYDDYLPDLKGTFSTILIDTPWRFDNRTGKMAPEHKRLRRYRTMSMDQIAALPVGRYARTPSHLYLWCPNALLPHGLQIMEAFGFTYKTNIVWYKVRKDGGPDGRGLAADDDIRLRSAGLNYD